MNSGRVYHTLINKVNNNLIKIIQEYNIIYIINNLKIAMNCNTIWIRFNIDNFNCSNSYIHRTIYGDWTVYDKN